MVAGPNVSAHPKPTPPQGQSRPHGIEFAISDDVNWVVLAQEQGKTLSNVASVVHDALKRLHIPDVGMQFYDMSPLTMAVEVLILMWLLH